ncbi:MAG: protein kinase [Xenococcaceae cyanobacterium]
MKSVVRKKLQNGKYTLNRELGEGGFGRTYLAHDEILDRLVVIKTFKSSPSQGSELANIRKQFLNEAQRLVQCYHPNIVRFYEFFIEDEVPYIVMDYIEGKTLDEIVFPENPLSEATAIKYIRQIGEALKVVHSKGLLHRDIKPQNLILARDNDRVVLIDFGISREFNRDLIQTHTSVVSDGYAPIEQYLPKAQRTPALDIYALAATMYTLVTAQIPIPATLRNRLTLDTPKSLRPELSEGLSTAIMLGMALEAEERPGSVEEWLNWLPQTNNVNNNSPSESVETVTLTKAKTKPIKLPTVTEVKKPRYSNRILQVLMAFAAIIWGLDYIWLRFYPSFQNDKIPISNLETLPPKQTPAISVEESKEPSSEAIKQSTSANKISEKTPSEDIVEQSTSASETSNTNSSTVSEKVVREDIPESATAKPPAGVTSQSSNSTVSTPAVNPQPIKKSTPPKTPKTTVSPSPQANPPRRSRINSKRVPSVFVSPGQKANPKINNAPERVPSVFVSPNERR